MTLPQLVDLYGRNGFDVLAVTDHVVRRNAPTLELREETFGTYLAEIASQAERARLEYDLLLLPGLELTYDDPDPSLAAHAVAVGCRAFVGVNDGIETALARARDEGAALFAAHPYDGDGRVASPARPTERFARDWRELAPLVDRWELFNRNELFGWVAEQALPAVANGDFHQLEHLHGWKTLLPCAKEELAVVDYLRSTRPAFLTRIDDVPLRQAA